MTCGKIDLHTHTTYSDGSYTPAQLIYKVRQAGIQTFSITDHDCVDALEEAEVLARFYEMHLIPGVEFTTYVLGKEVHILGYFFDRNNTGVQSLLKKCAEERVQRAVRIIEALQKIQVEISLEEVLAEAGKAPITRPHIASVLVKKQIARSFYDAFETYLGNDGPCYVQKFALAPEVVFSLMHEAGGISVIAHPSNLDGTILKNLIAAGVDGIEVFHPAHNNVQTTAFAELAKKHDLFVSGGSDFHGGKKNDEPNLGRFHTPEASFTAMLAHVRKAQAV